MTEFYILPDVIRFLISMATDLCVMIQVLAVAYSFLRFRRGWVQDSENLLEICILIQLFLNALLMAEVQYQASDGFVFYGGYLTQRWIVFGVLCVMSILLSAAKKTFWPLGVLAASAATLPAAEHMVGYGFSIVYLLALLYWLLRSIHIVLLRYREMHTRISTLSVKEAIDSLNSGILFCEMDGLILLCNRQMLELMAVLTGENERSGIDFLGKLKAGEVLEVCQREYMDDQLIYRLPDHTIWMFSVHEIRIRHETYFMLFAADHTHQWKIAQGLLSQNRALEQREQQLKQRMHDLREECRREELFRAKSWSHDILGQRISLLLRALREQRKPDEMLLQSLAEGLNVGLTDTVDESPEHALQTLIQVYQRLGVLLQIDGQLPNDRERADTFVQIATECVSNAVRHGYATRVTICFRNGQMMDVENNGTLPDEKFTEGGGIREMRRKAERLGGSLFVQVRPRFHLCVIIPEGGSE